MKTIPWWYTESGNDAENEYFSGLYYDWAMYAFGALCLVPESTNYCRAFIAEQLAGEIIENENEETQ